MKYGKLAEYDELNDKIRSSTIKSNKKQKLDNSDVHRIGKKGNP